MTVYGNRIYNEPEDYSLELLESLDCHDGGYGFDKFAIWFSRDRGMLYYAEDSGCSCPSPFEDLKFPVDFMTTPRADLEPLRRALEEWVSESDGRWNVSPSEVVRRISRMLQAKKRQAKA